MSVEEETLLKFPCEFPIKVMGLDQPDLHAFVKQTIDRHAPGTPSSDYSQSVSRTGKFVSITVKIAATSKGQLDAIYQEFSNSDLTNYVL